MPDEVEDSRLVIESADVEVSGQIREVNVPGLSDAVFGFASYLSGRQTFKAGSRGDSSKLATFAAEFCAENDWGDVSKDFPDNINFPEE